jgi:hypothetical protein
MKHTWEKGKLQLFVVFKTKYGSDILKGGSITPCHSAATTDMHNNILKKNPSSLVTH